MDNLEKVTSTFQISKINIMILESVFDKNNFFSYKQQGMAIQCLSFEKVDSVMYDKSLKFRFPPFS